MTYEERESIFSKEALSLDDLSKLFGIHKSTASMKMQDIKRQLGKDRLKIEGKLHVLDYLEWLDIENNALMDRYNRVERDHTRDDTGFFSKGRFL